MSPRSRSRLGLVLAGLFGLGIALCTTAGLVLAQPAGPDTEAERLTHTLVALHARSRLTGSAEQARLLGNLVSVAATRQQLLAEIIENNPREVLRAALPADLRASLPAAVQAYVEEEVEVKGELVVLHEDHDQGSRYLYFLHTAAQRFSFHFAAESPDAITGMQVRVSGLRVGEALALGSGSTSVQTLVPAALPNTLGAQSTLVILVNFQDNPTQPYTVEYARNVVFSTTSDFLLENSYQQTWLTGDVAGWYTIPLSNTVCDLAAIASHAKSAAAAAGFNLAAYKHYVYAFPKNGCGGLGAGTIGGNPSQAWIIGSLDLKVVSHELGHNFGLYHSHALDCGASVLGTSCTVFEYGDRMDTMGNIAAGHYNAFQKERLGWLDYGTSPPITTVQANGLYTLGPFEAASVSPKALAILQSTDATTGQQTWYYVEYRQALGFDSFLATNSNILNGVSVHTGSPSNGDSSYLLDMTPASTSQNWSDWSDPALEIGQSFYDPDSGVTIAPVSVSSTDAIVSVSFASPGCIHANPTVSLSPSQSQWVSAGTTAIYKSRSPITTTRAVRRPVSACRRSAPMAGPRTSLIRRW